MFRKGDIVERLVEPMEGNFRKGTRDIVKEVLNDKEFTLENHEGIYLQRNFRLESLSNPNQTMSDIDSITQALKVIDNWNRTHPTGLMVSIEAYPAQDGGSLFSTPSFDSHSVEDMVAYLLDYASNEEKATVLERAAKALRFGV